MNNDEWEKQRQLAISAAFQTGRPIFADSDGKMHFADGDREAVPATLGDEVVRHPQLSIYTKAMRASRAAFVASIVAAGINVVAGFWHPWCFAVAPVWLLSSLGWHRFHRRQRALCGAPR